MIRRPPRSTLDRSSAASDVYKRQVHGVIKLLRAHGGCLGIRRLCRALKTAKSPGELSNKFCSRDSRTVVHCIHRCTSTTQGTETSKYLQEKKEKSIP
eukprot:TRINITY_DN145_c0_g1_i5.p2 TRINITY_DN145_c0_g1~~TRINITY_DN145_c0_g1_i5.p2  ORF type:complete len:106 (-),score=6.88 TRINITY_DN145_c0_g1_i5:23-316(-)